jgi:membrane-associated HD superfamily phosphohydrolase
MATTRVRPSQVTIVVVLLWIGFALTLIGGIATILAGTAIAASDPAVVAEKLVELDLPEAWNTTAGPITIVAGIAILIVALIYAIFAVAVSRGSNIARVLITILIIIRVIAGIVFIVSSWGTPAFTFGIFLSLALDIIILLLLFNHASNEFFSDEVETD